MPRGMAASDGTNNSAGRSSSPGATTSGRKSEGEINCMGLHCQHGAQRGGKRRDRFGELGGLSSLGALLTLATLLQTAVPASGVGRQTGQAEIGKPSSSIMLAHEQVPYEKYSTRSRPDVDRRMPMLTGKDAAFSGSARYGAAAQQSYRSVYEMHPFLGPARGGTEVRFVFSDVFPGGITDIYCRFGGQLAEPMSWGYKKAIGAMEVMCLAPPGLGNTHVKAGISLNGVEFFPGGRGTQLFYYYKDPVVTAVMPQTGDIRGGTRVSFFLSEDVLGNSLRHIPKQRFTEALRAVRCMFDRVVVPSEGVHMCIPSQSTARPVPCVVCISPPSEQREVGQVQVRLAMNSINWAPKRAPFVYMDYSPVQTARSEFGFHSFDDALEPNQRFVDDNGNHIDPEDIPMLKSALSEFYGLFYGAIDTISVGDPPDYQFYDGMYSFYSTGAVGTDRAEVCVTAIRPSTGPAAGGTVVSIRAQGTIPFGHFDFYCVFHNHGNIVKASATEYDSAEDAVVLTCVTPPGEPVSTEYIGISLDGISVSPLGAPFYYHGVIEMSELTPEEGPSHGGTALTVKLASNEPLPANADADAVYTTCKFSHVSMSETVTEEVVEGVYTPAAGATPPTVGCLMPGLPVDTVPSGNVSVTVSLNGLDYANSSLIFTALRYSVVGEQVPVMDLYGLQISAGEPGETIYPEQTLLEPASLVGLTYTELPYSLARCLSYPRTSIATLSELQVVGDILSDVNETTFVGDVKPELAPGVLVYTAEVPYQMYEGFSLQGVTTDSFANMFVRGQVVPRGGRSVVTAHDDEAGVTSAELTVLSSDSTTSLTYTVMVSRGPAGTEDRVATVNITGALPGETEISPVWDEDTFTGYTARVRSLYGEYLLIEPQMVDPYSRAIVTSNETVGSETVGFNQPTTAANLSLPIGFSVVTITGVSEGGVVSAQSIYQILIERVAPQTVSTLADMIITSPIPAAAGAVLTPSVWKPDVTSYTLSLLFEEDAIIFKPVPTDEVQEVTVKFNGGPGTVIPYDTVYNLTSIPVGTSLLTFVSVGEDLMNTTVYNITLLRESKSGDATLANILTESCGDDTQGLLSPSFAAGTYTYDVVISHQCQVDSLDDRIFGVRPRGQDITITPFCSDFFCSHINVTFPDGTSASGPNGTSFTVPIPTASVDGITVDATSQVPITVTAEDGITTATYSLQVTRLARSSIAGLLNLTVDGSFSSQFPTSGVLYQSADMKRGFDASVFRYFMEVEADVSTVSLMGYNSHVFSITAVELNPPNQLTFSTSNPAILVNGTTLTVTDLLAGQNNTLRVRVHAERYQPEQKFEYHSPFSYKDYVITVFRRTVSSDTTLESLELAVGSLGRIPTTTIGTPLPLSPVFDSNTTSYVSSAAFSVSGVAVTPLLPPTGGDVSVLDNVNRGKITVGGSLTNSGSDSAVQTLSVGNNTVDVVVTAEDGVSTRTYEVNVTRSEPNLDTSLVRLIPGAGWIVADGQSGENGTEADPAADFSPDTTRYTVRGLHPYQYLSTVLPNERSGISFTPVANASVNGLPAVSITINGQEVANGTESPTITLPNSTFPVPSSTVVDVVVFSEDFSINKTYAITVTRAPMVPDPSFWIQFYRIVGGPNVSTVDPPSGANVSTWVTADDVVPVTLEIDPDLWNATFSPSIPDLANDYSPVSELVFQPMYSVNGGAYEAYGDAYTLDANSTTKSLNLLLSGGRVGEISIKVMAYGLDVNGTLAYGTEHGWMSLGNSVMDGPSEMGPGTAEYLLTPYDSYGNLISDGQRVYSTNELDAYVCPNATTCNTPGAGEARTRPDFKYNVFYSMSTNGLNFLHLEGRYRVARPPVPQPDILAGSPIGVTVEGNALGVRSFVETIPYRSWVVVEDPAYFFIHARDDFGNDIFEGGQADQLEVTTSPPLVDVNGDEIPPVIEDVSVPGQRGKYRVTLPSTAAGELAVIVRIAGGFNIENGVFTLNLLPADIGAENTPVLYPQDVLAGEEAELLITATDAYGNVLEFDDLSAYIEVEILQLTGVRRRGLTQLINRVELPIDFTITKRNTVYAATFTAPTDASVTYGLRVLIFSFPLRETAHPVTDEPQPFNVLPGPPTVADSLYVVPSQATAGELKLAVKGIDQYGNIALDGPWLAVASPVAGGGTAVETGLSGQALTADDPDLQAIDLGGAGLTTAGTYNVRLFVGEEEVMNGFPATISITPDSISALSTVTSPPSQVTIGTTVSLYISAVDGYGNSIASGGEAALISPYISNVFDAVDSIDAVVTDNRGGAYTVTFAPSKAGTFSVAIRFDGQLRQPVPQFVSIVQATTPEDYAVTTTASLRPDRVYEVDIQQSVVFTVTPNAGVPQSLVARSVLSATLVFLGTGSAETLAVTEPSSTGVRTVTFVKEVSGQYRLELLVEGQPLVGSPFLLEVVAGTPILYYVEQMPSIAFNAGQPVDVYVHVLDSLGNTVAVDTATELAVTFEQQPGGELTYGVIEADLVDGFPEGNGAGYRGRATLTIAAVYRLLVTLNVGGVVRSLCRSGVPAGMTNCLPELSVTPSVAFAPASLLTGSGASSFLVGDSVSLTVYSLDGYDNSVMRSYAASALAYEAVITGPEGLDDPPLQELTLVYNPTDNTHQLTYSLTTAGDYQLQVLKTSPRDEPEALLDGQEFPYTVGGAPLSLTVSAGAANATNTEIEELVEEAVVGRDNSLFFSMRDSYGNAVTANLLTSLKVIINGAATTLTSVGAAGGATLRYQSDGRYAVTYRTAFAGSYTANVYLDDVPGASKQVEVLAGPASPSSTAIGSGLFTATAGTSSGFMLLAADSYGNQRRRLSDTGSSPFLITMTLTQRGTGDTLSTAAITVPPGNITTLWSAADAGYRVQYLVGLAGSLSISVRVGGVHITSSPFVAQVLAGPTSAAHSTVAGLGLRGTVVGRPASFTIRARDVNGNLRSSGGDPFRVSLRCVSTATCSGASFTASILDNDDGTYTVTYSSSAAGQFSLDMTLRNAHVGVIPSRSPLSITVLAAAGPISYRNTAARGVGLVEARAGLPATFTITAADALGIQLSSGGARFVVELAEFLSGDGVVATGPVTELTSRVAGQPNSVVDNQDGTYTIRYTVTTATRFSLMVWADSAKTTNIAVPPSATGWPVTVNVFPGLTDPATCLLDPTAPLPTRAQAGQAIQTRVLAYDSFGNRQRYVAGVQASDEFSIVATAPGAPTARGTASQSADARGYDFSLVIDSLGSYQVSIRLRNPLTGALEVIGAGETYTISVIAGGISGPRSLASGAGLSGGVAGANLPISVLVNDGGGNPVVVAGLPGSTCLGRLRPATGPNQGCTMGGASVGPATGICDCLTVQCTVDPDSSSRYLLNARSTCADTFALSISLNGSAVASSPFRIPVAPGPTSASASRPSGMGLTFASAGEITTFIITAADSFGNRRTIGGDVFVVWMQHGDGTPDVFAAVDDLGTGEYSVTYTPAVMGSHALNIQLNGQPVGSSPYGVTVGVSATSASASYIIMPPGGASAVVAGEETELTLVAISETGARQEGGLDDSFEVSIEPDADGFGNVLTPIAQRTAPGEPTYALRFSAQRVVYSADSEPAPYVLSVRLNGEHIKGSPMEVFVSPGPVVAQRSELFDSGSDLSTDADDLSEFGAVAGQRRELLLQLRDIFGNDAAYDPLRPLPDVGMRVSGAEADPSTASQDITDTVEVVDTEDARFRVSYRALVAGSYVLRPVVNGAVIGDGQGIATQVVPGPFHLPSFTLRGPGITEPAAAGIAFYFVVEPRDAYGNFRPDDGRLVCFTGNVIYPGVDPELCPPDLLELRMHVRTGGRLSGFQREEVEVAELIFEPKAGQGESGPPWQRGMYRAEFEARMDGELVTELALGDQVAGPYYAPITAAAVLPSSITLGGAGAQGTALGVGGTPTETVAVHIEPRDSYGNLAASSNNATVDLTATFIDPVLGVQDGVLTVSEVEWDEALRAYVFTYSATTTGSVRLEILYNGVAIGDGEPVLLPIYQQFGAVDPAFTFLEGPALDGVIVGEQTYVNVVLRSTSQLAECFQDSMGEPLAAVIKLQRGCKGLPYPFSAGDDFVSAELSFEEVNTITDQGNGTYTVFFTVQDSGTHALTVRLGPQPDNPQIGSVQAGIGLGESLTLLAHPGPTTQAAVSFMDINGQGQPAGSLVTFFSGQPLKISISPQDMFGNLQSYVAAPMDEFRVDVLFNGFQSVPIDYLERRSTSTLVAASVFFEAQLTLNITGEYLVDVLFRGDSTDGEWISVTTSTRVTLLPGLPSVTATEISGEGLHVSPAGSPARLRITLLDAGGNALGDGLTQRSLVEALILSGAYEVDTDTVITPEPAPVTTPAPSLPPVTTPPANSPATPPPDDSPTGTPFPGDIPTGTPTPDPTMFANLTDGTPTPTGTQQLPTPTATPESQGELSNFTTTVAPDAVAARRRLAQLLDVPPVVTAVLVSSTGEVPVSVVYDPIQHYYRGEYTTFTAGRYYLNVRLYGKRLVIPNYQYTAVLAGAEHTPSCTVSGTGAGDAGPLPAGEMAEFTIQGVDVNGNLLARGGANWEVLLESAIDTDNTLDSDNWVVDGSHFLRAASITDMQNGRYRVAYRPLVAATYLLSVRRGGVHVSGSPFVVEVRAGPTVAAQSVLTCDDAVEGACGLMDLPAGNQGVFYIQARDRYGGNKTTSEDQFFYSVVGSGGYSKDSVAVSRGQTFPGQYRATFNTEKAGPLTVAVTLRGSLVARVSTAIMPGRVDALRCTLSSAAFPTAPVWTPGQEPDVITITARDTYGNALTEGGLTFDVLMVKTDSSYSVTLSVSDLGDGTYQSTYINKEPGEYRVTGKLGLESLPSQALSLRAGPAVVAHTEVLSSSGVSGTLGTDFRAGSNAVFWLRFKDTWLNTRVVADTYSALGGASLRVSSDSEIQNLTPVVSFSGEEQLEECLEAAFSPAALAQCETAYGSFRLSFTPTLAGTLRLSFAVQDDVLLDSETGLPFQTVVSPGPAALETSTVYGSALNGCVGGASCTLFIRLADQYGNTLDRPGLLGVEQSLALSYELEGSGAGPPAVAMANIQPIVSDMPSGVQRVVFTPPSFQPGDYLIKLSVRLVSNIPDSSAGSGRLDELLIFVYRDNAPLQASSSAPLDLQGQLVSPGSSIGSFPSGSVTILQVQLRDRNGVDFLDFVGTDYLRADLQPQVDDLIVVEDGPGLLSVRFTPSISGTYSLTLADAEGSPVGGSTGQYELTVTPAFPSSPALSRLELVSDGRLGESVPSLSATAGVAFTVQVQAVDAYGNLQMYSVESGPEPFEVQLSRRVDDPGEEEAAPPIACVVYDNNDATYSAVCVGTVAGDYDLEVGLRGQDGVVPLGEGAPGDPPILLTIGHGEVFAPESTFDPPAATLSGLLLAAGSPYEFTIQARDTYGNLHTSGGLSFALEVEVEGEGAGASEEGWVSVLAEVNGRVTSTEGGLYLARLTPVRSVRHRVTVRERSSGLIAGQPFTMEVEPGSAEAELAEATGSGLAGGTAGFPMRFTLALRDAYGNLVGGQAEAITLAASPVAQADGTASTSPSLSILINETAPGLLAVHYNLSRFGEYDVDVLLRTTRVPGSPFRVVVSPRPPPVITSATFDANLGSLTAQFSEATDRGGSRYAAAVTATGGSEGTCDALLPTALLAKLGDDPNCAWVSDSSLRVFFGRGATLLPTELSAQGDTFRLASDRVSNKAGNSYGVVSRVSIGMPEGSVASPTASLAGPTVIGVCADLVLDATASSGGSGRPLELSFSAFAADGRSTRVSQQLAQAVLAAASDSPGLVTLPSAALDPGRRYNFRLAATNFLGSSSMVELEVLKSALPLPQVAILGTAMRRIRRSSDTMVSASAAVPDITCLESAGSLGGSRIVFLWEQVDGASVVESDFPTPEAFAKYTASLDTRYLYLPANTLGVAVRPDGSLRSYTYRLTATMEADPVLTASTEVELQVEPDPISARIMGGSSIALPRGAPLQLEVATSDPSEAVDTEGVPTPFLFLWSCQTTGGGVCFPPNHPGNTALVTAETTLTLPAGSLAVGEYVFSVEVTREPITPTRRVHTSVTVAVGEGVGALAAEQSEPGGVVVVVPPDSSTPSTPDGGEGEGEGEEEIEPAWVLGIVAPLAAEVSPTRRIVLQGVITPPPDWQPESGEEAGEITVRWSCAEGDLSGSGALARVADNALNASYLSLPSGSLTPGQLYRFRLTGGGVAAGAVAEVSLLVAAAPWGGTLEVTSPGGTTSEGRPAGTELLTRFSLRARDWSNSAGIVDYAYVPHMDTLLEGAGVELADWALHSRDADVIAAERYLGRAPAGAVSLEAILPEGIHMVVAYITSPFGATSRAVFPDLFQLDPPPTLRRALAQQQLFATQARRAVNLALQPALDTGDRALAHQFLAIYTSRYAGEPPADPLEGCQLSALEGVTREVTEVAVELQAVEVRFDLRSSEDVCTLSELVSDPTATDTDTAAIVLGVLLGMLRDEELMLTRRAQDCSARLLSATIVNAASVCRAGGGREQSLLDEVRSGVVVFAEAISRELRAGMAPLVFDTQQLTVQVAAHSAARATGEAVGVVAGRPGVPPSASYDITFATSTAALPLPSSPRPSLELRSALAITATVSLLPPESESQRLASQPASLQLWAIHVTPTTSAYVPAELPEMTSARLTRAPVTLPTDGFSPTLYTWRGADWASFGGTALMAGNAAWGVTLNDSLPLGLEPELPNHLTFAVWLRDVTETSTPSPSVTPPPSPPPPTPLPLAITGSEGIPSWVYWAVPIVAVSLLLLIIGILLLWRRRRRVNQLQALHPAEGGGRGKREYVPPGEAASPGDTPRTASSAGSESRALVPPNAALGPSLSGAEQAARAAANAPSFARALQDETESNEGTDIGSSDDDVGGEEAMAYTVHDPFRNAPPARTHQPAQPAVPVPTGHFQTIGGTPPTSSTQRQALFDNRRPGRATGAERMRSGAVQPGTAPRASAQLDGNEGRAINRDHWTGRTAAGRTRPADGGKY